MSSQSPTAILSSGLPSRPGDLFAKELATLVQDIQRTQEWFNNRLDAQLASLKRLYATRHTEESKNTLSMATLFEAPRTITQESAPVTVLPPRAAAKMVPTIILAPPLMAALDPQLEQATLHELNNALTRAFSEISARGGMMS
jgi:hypothetical protein